LVDLSKSDDPTVAKNKNILVLLSLNGDFKSFLYQQVVVLLMLTEVLPKKRMVLFMLYVFLQNQSLKNYSYF
jgi:hypothetical protein